VTPLDARRLPTFNWAAHRERPRLHTLGKRTGSYDHCHRAAIRDDLPILGADVERAGGRLCRDWFEWPSLSDKCGRGISGVGGSMSFISQRGKEYLGTARTFLPVAQTMTDRAIAGRLKVLADDFQRRAKKASHVDYTEIPGLRVR
jgi:hypothetical protein